MFYKITEVKSICVKIAKVTIICIRAYPRSEGMDQGIQCSSLCRNLTPPWYLGHPSKSFRMVCIISLFYLLNIAIYFVCMLTLTVRMYTVSAFYLSLYTQICSKWFELNWIGLPWVELYWIYLNLIGICYHLINLVISLTSQVLLN